VDGEIGVAVPTGSLLVRGMQAAVAAIDAVARRAGFDLTANMRIRPSSGGLRVLRPAGG
jgi:hypothetical protein